MFARRNFLSELGRDGSFRRVQSKFLIVNFNFNAQFTQCGEQFKCGQNSISSPSSCVILEEADGLRVAQTTVSINSADWCDSGSHEEIPQWNVDLKRLADARSNLCCKEGMSAQFKEVIVDADLLQFEHIHPDLGNGLFHLSLWRSE